LIRIGRLRTAVPSLGRSEAILGLKAVVLISSVSALFLQDLRMVFVDAVQSESASHVLAVPAIFAFLVYWKKRMLRATVTQERSELFGQFRHLASVSGTLLLFTGLLIYWYGSRTFTPLEYHLFALPIFASGLILILFNSLTLRELLFPLLFLLFLTPPPSELLYGVGSLLSVFSSEVSTALANLFGLKCTLISEYANPTILLTRSDASTVAFTVDIACSGIYGLIGFLVFAAFLAYIVRDKPWKKIVTFLLGLPLIYALNLLRITFILMIGHQYGEQLALQVFHLLGGWTLIFVGTVLLLTITERVFKMRFFTRRQLCPTCSTAPATIQGGQCPSCGRLIRFPDVALKRQDIMKMSLLALAVVILLLVQTPVFALTQAPSQVTVQTPNGEQGNPQLLPQITGYILEFVYRDRNFEQRAKQDFSLVYVYIPTNRTAETISVAVELSQAQSSLHRWETCLITWPETKGYIPTVRQLDMKDVLILRNPDILARFFAFQYSKFNQTQLVLYWYETSTFSINGTMQQEHVKISLVTYPATPQNITEAEDRLLPFATTIAAYWEPIKLSSQVTHFFSDNAGRLILTSGLTLAATVTIPIYEKRRQGHQNSTVYSKLSAHNKSIIDAVREAQKTGPPTIQSIAKTFNEMTGIGIEYRELYAKLIQAQQIGIIKNRIFDRQGEPVQTWSVNIQEPLSVNERLRRLVSPHKFSQEGSQP